MKRIYHHYELWEDWKHGFYDSCSGSIKEQKIKKVIEMFNDAEKTKHYMSLVPEQWPRSCEHNLTNESLNQIAYIGQSACCLYDKIPSTVTMEAWSMLAKDVQDRSDKLAEDVINKWKNNKQPYQLCLNFF